MPIDATAPQSPGWWFSKLLTELGDRQTHLTLLDDYYRGNATLPAGPHGCQEAFRRFQAKSRTNFAALVVEAVRERMQVTGFRTGAEDDDLGDKDAWRIWQANGLDSGSGLVHRAKLAMGDAYVIVGGPDPDTGVPLITPEDPRQVITAHDPRNQRRVVAALKVFADDMDAVDLAYLYLPGQVWVANRARAAGSTVAYQLGGWEWHSRSVLPAKVVPVVRFANRQDLAGQSMGEFEDVIDVLDRINHMLLQRMTIATLQAFRQRAVKGVPDVDENGDPIDYAGVFTADPGALWLLPDGAEMWESGQVDLTPLLTSVRHDIQDLAAVTRTPLFYLTPDAANGSAEGASLAREGLVFKAGDRIAHAGEAWEQVMSLAFRFAGDDPRANRVDMETVWASPERFSLAERFDAASKAQAAGLTWRATMLDVLQLSPQQVDRMETERATDLLTAPFMLAAANNAA